MFQITSGPLQQVRNLIEGKSVPLDAAGVPYPDSNVRNICIAAHVDHGKTTLSDHLVACNQHVSQKVLDQTSRQTGPRFLDSREDEAVRQITIKTSVIALALDEGNKLVNLLDSPGHLDFSAEVNVAARLADGALVGRER